MNNIEVEIRSFISEEQYEKLLIFFKKEAKKFIEDYHETHYFDTKEDFRIYKTNTHTILLLKKGKIHDDTREETELKLPKEDFEKTEKLFLDLGFKIKVKWYRKRFEFDWQEIKVCLDYTKGYGYIIELEIMTNKAEKEKALSILQNKIAELKINPTSKEEFSEKFKFYEENWQKLT